MELKRIHPLSDRLWMIKPYLASVDLRQMRRTCRGFFYDSGRENANSSDSLTEIQKELLKIRHVELPISSLCQISHSKFFQRREKLSKEFIDEMEYDVDYTKYLSEKVNRHLVKSYERNAEGLAYDGSKANFMSLDCCVSQLPTGDETGVYYGLDVGGTNIRVVRCELQGHGKSKVTSEGYCITDHDTGKTGSLLSPDTPATALFDYIAMKVKDVMKAHKDDLSNTTLSIGLCFSFAIQMEAIDRAIVLAAGKNFDTGKNTDDPLLGCDAVAKLNESFTNNGVDAVVVGCLNDTTGTMFCAAYEAKKDQLPPVRIGMIVGTGFNACVSHDLATHYKYQGNTVNLEAGFLRCRDHDVDTIYNFDTAYKLPYLAEKRVSGAWLGEVVRYALVWILGAESPPGLFKKGVLSCGKIADIMNASYEGDKVCSVIKTVMKNALQWNPPSSEHINIIEAVVNAVWRRSAKTVASIIVGVVQHISAFKDGGEITIGVDGSVYCKNPPYQEMIRSCLTEVLGEKQKRIHLIQTTDGSGKGAAMLACARVNSGHAGDLHHNAPQKKETQ